MAVGGGLRQLSKEIDAPVRSGDIRDGAVKLRDLDPGLQQAVGRQAVPGPVGPQGAPGAPGQALAFARIGADGTVDPAASRGIETVSAANGLYCLRYTGGEPHVVTGMIDISGADGRKTIIAGSAVKPSIDAAGECPAATNIEMVTSNAASQSKTPAPFFLVVTL